MKLKRGEVGERMAEQWFLNHGWRMVRTQPAATILAIVSPLMTIMLGKFIPRLANYGHMVIARMGRGGVADYTGYWHIWSGPLTEYRACEVKEASGETMPASRLDKPQRVFLKSLPDKCAYVGIFWTDIQKFKIYPFIDSGSYKSKEGLT